ncbi:MAG: hypothetical protein KF905_16265 [Flavobacteriales bacterium]|nr:hypothetical protein [Flavobacteriales bacterium]
MDQYAPVPAQRPTLLTVLCILSFIAGAWGVVDGYRTGFTDKPQRDLEEARTTIEEAMEQMGGGSGLAERMMEEGLAAAEQTVQHAQPIGISGLALSALSLFGVWLMWNLKRNGFYLYVLAGIGGLIAPIAILGTSSVVIMGMGISGFFTVLFIVLYAVNLKHMS